MPTQISSILPPSKKEFASFTISYLLNTLAQIPEVRTKNEMTGHFKATPKGQ